MTLNNARVPKLNVNIGDKFKIIAVIDSGAELNGISERLVLKMKNEGIPMDTIPSHNLQLQFANGKKSGKITKQIFFAINIKGVEMTINAFIVPGLGVDLVLGMDFMVANNVLLSGKLNAVYIKCQGEIKKTDFNIYDDKVIDNTLQVFFNLEEFQKEVRDRNLIGSIDEPTNSQMNLMHNVNEVNNLEKKENEANWEYESPPHKKRNCSASCEEDLNRDNGDQNDDLPGGDDPQDQGRSSILEQDSDFLPIAQEDLWLDQSETDVYPLAQAWDEKETPDNAIPFQQQLAEKLSECQGITDGQRKQLNDVLKTYEDVFNPNGHFRCNKYMHQFDFDPKIDSDFKPRTYPVSIGKR